MNKEQLGTEISLLMMGKTCVPSICSELVPEVPLVTAVEFLVRHATPPNDRNIHLTYTPSVLPSVAFCPATIGFWSVSFWCIASSPLFLP